MSQPATERMPDRVPIRIEGFEPSWAGPHPLEEGFCIGSEDGRVAFTDVNGNFTGDPFLLAKSGEAISGVAGTTEWLAAGTRREVAILFPDKDGDGGATLKTIDQGVHGVLAPSEHLLVAALGHGGLMMVTPIADGESRIDTYSFEGYVNVYQVQELPGNRTPNAFVAACRSNGVGLMFYSADEHKIEWETWQCEGIDVVDVAPVGTPAFPNAVAAAGISGEIILFRDIVNHDRPILLKYDEFQGRTYRVMSADGDLFILTSKAMYVIGGLAKRLNQPTMGEQSAPVMSLPMNALDANVCGNRWLLAVKPDEVARYDIQQIHDIIADFAATGRSLPRAQMRCGWTELGARRFQPTVAGSC